jgi:hypothetical protein
VKSTIFCPNCNDLILDQPTCPACGWRRPVEAEGAGQLAWCADLGTRLVKPHCYPAVAAGRYCLGSEDGTLKVAAAIQFRRIGQSDKFSLRCKFSIPRQSIVTEDTFDLQIKLPGM